MLLLPDIKTLPSTIPLGILTDKTPNPPETAFEIISGSLKPPVKSGNLKFIPVTFSPLRSNNSPGNKLVLNPEDCIKFIENGLTVSLFKKSFTIKLPLWAFTPVGKTKESSWGDLDTKLFIPIWEFIPRPVKLIPVTKFKDSPVRVIVLFIAKTWADESKVSGLWPVCCG